MKQLLFLLLFPCLAMAQYQGNAGQKITLGEQTTADGLVYRGVASADTIRKPSIDTMAFILLDTNTNIIWQYKKAVNNAWTRINLLLSDTTSFNYVNTYGTQTVNGSKTFTSDIISTRFRPSASTPVGTGIYLPAANTLGFSNNSVERMIILAGGNVGIGTSSPSRLLDVNGIAKATIFDINGEGFFRGDFSGEMRLQSGTSNLAFRNNANNAYLAVITNTGRVGIGQTTPTAVLHLKAGTATASTAPLKFTSGVNLTTAEAGVMEFNGTNLLFTPSTTRHTVNHGLTGSAELDFLSTNAQNSRDMTITVTGAADGDVVSLGVPNASVNANTSYSAWVSAANTVTVRFNNYSSGTVDPASGLFKVFVTK